MKPDEEMRKMFNEKDIDRLTLILNKFLYEETMNYLNSKPSYILNVNYKDRLCDLINLLTVSLKNLKDYHGLFEKTCNLQQKELSSALNSILSKDFEEK